jgi:hypothetical protein
LNIAIKVARAKAQYPKLGISERNWELFGYSLLAEQSRKRESEA